MWEWLWRTFDALARPGYGAAQRDKGVRAMRAVIFSETTRPIEVAEVDLARPGPGEVRVRISAAGVCGSDLHVRRGDWQVPVPLVMGHEGSGVVAEVGPGVTGLAEGDHVVLSWVAPCGNCRFCRAGHEARCEVAAAVDASGTLQDGTTRLSRNGETLYHYLGVSSFAEEAVVPASGAIKVRDDAPLDTIALIGCAVATGVGAVRNTAAMEPGSVVAVIGCGGVGLSVVQGARLCGAERIIAMDIRAEKTALARKFGATDEIDVKTTDAADALRELAPDGVDYAFDAIGMTTTTEQAIRMLGLGGAAVVVGLPPEGAYARFDPLTLATTDQRILGSNYGSVRPAIDIPTLVEYYMEGQLFLEDLISARRPLAEAAASLDELESGMALRTLLIP